ncbi:hypothetical protein BDZ89DRAFT_1052958 [Hymenopellis radicata]|nr:hypothetical protein BDZ89DRAFT_1052958 [Hymenopellis radicata]
MPHRHPPAIAGGASTVHDPNDAMSVEDGRRRQQQEETIKTYLCRVACRRRGSPYPPPPLFKYAVQRGGRRLLLEGLRVRVVVFPWRRLKVVLHLYGADSESSAGVFIADLKSSDGTSECLHGCLGTGTHGPKPDTRTRVDTRPNTLPGTAKHLTPGCQETNERITQEVFAVGMLPLNCRYPPDPAFVHAAVLTFLTEVNLYWLQERFGEMGVYEVEDLVTLSLDVRNPTFHDELACALEVSRAEWGRLKNALEHFVRPANFDYYKVAPDCPESEDDW